MQIEHYTVELASYHTPIILTLDALPAPSESAAICAALFMVADLDEWFVSSCRMTNEKRLTKAEVL
jgi:hypothetical protein